MAIVIMKSEMPVRASRHVVTCATMALPKRQKCQLIGMGGYIILNQAHPLKVAMHGIFGNRTISQTLPVQVMLIGQPVMC